MAGLLKYCLAVITLGSICAVDDTVTHTDRKRPRVRGKIGNNEAEFLVDSGASVSVVSETMFNSLWSHWTIRRLPIPRTLRISGVTGHTMSLVDYVEVELTILGRTFIRPLLVVSGLSLNHAILGYDFIKEEGLVIDGAANSIYFKDKQTMGETWSVAALASTRRLTLQPRSVHKVYTVATIGDAIVPHNAQGVAMPIEGHHIGVWDTATTVGQWGEVVITAINTSDKPVELRPGDILATLRNPAAFEETLMPLDEETISAVFGDIGHDPPQPSAAPATALNVKDRQALIDKLHIEAPAEWRQRYIDLIMRYHDVVSKDKYDLGHASVIKHSIRMRDKEPVHVKQFRTPLYHEDFIYDYVDELLKRGAIEVSRSPYNSPIFCVVKKKLPDAKPDDPVPLRVVLDYRQVNARSLPDRYSIKEVRECIDAIGKEHSAVFSAIDLTSGFWQQELEEESRQYTAFSVPSRGLRLQWRVAPMGLQGSPASFARLMDYVMTGLKNVLTYIDDVLCHDRSHETHLRTLEQVFLRLRRYGLKLNADKSIFGAAEVQYLGYTINAEGVTLSKDKFAAIRDFPMPTTIRNVREFVGLVNYFRFLIPHFNRLTEPLTRLTRKEINWQGGKLPPTAATAFNTLREALCSAPVVEHPKKDDRFILRSDAALGDKDNAGGFGAVLLQKRPDGREAVIAYASRPLKDHEKNYSAYLLETAAAVWAIEHFDVYLIGRQFTLVTDHKPLETIGTVHTKTLSRLQQLLLEYDFTIEYRKGSDNTVADFLSRTATVSAISDNDGDLQRLQKLDQRMNDIRTFLQHGTLPTNDATYAMKIQRFAANSFVEDNLLWYRSEGRTREHYALWAPQEVQKNIIRAAHLNLEAGHGGVQRTVDRIKSNYYWPGMSNDVTKFVRNCETCQKAKGRQPGKAPLQSMPTCDAPNQRIHIDLVGPLRTSESGNKYIMVMTDAFTKYVELASITSKDSTTVAKTFFERWIVRYSAPERIVTDQGKEFCNRVVQDMCELWRIDKDRTSPYHPQTNSSAESFNRSLKKYLLAMLDNDTTLDWEPLLPCLMLAYNCHVHSSTGDSPFFLTYLHDPRLPYFDLDKPRKFYATDYVSDTFKLMQTAYHGVKLNMEEAKKTSEAYYNRQATARQWLPGDRVLVYYPNAPQGCNPKFHKHWVSYTVVKMVGRVNVLVRKTATAKPVLVHADRVRDLHHDNAAETAPTPTPELLTPAPALPPTILPQIPRRHTRSMGPPTLAYLDDHQLSEEEVRRQQLRQQAIEEEEEEENEESARYFFRTRRNAAQGQIPTSPAREQDESLQFRTPESDRGSQGSPAASTSGFVTATTSFLGNLLRQTRESTTLPTLWTDSSFAEEDFPPLEQVTPPHTRSQGPAQELPLVPPRCLSHKQRSPRSPRL